MALRGHKRNKLLSFINITGLTLGIACCMSIVLYVSQELSYENYHEHSDNTYIMGIDEKLDDSQSIYYSTQPPLGPTLKAVFPSVENQTRVMRFNDKKIIEIENNKYNLDKIYAADSTFFDIFTVKFLAGNKLGLSAPKSIVINKTTALKYFKTIESAINKTISFDRNDFNVSAVIEDCPNNTELKYNALYTLESVRWVNHNSWDGYSMLTYVRLTKGSDIKLLENKIAGLVKMKLEKEFKIYQEPNHFKFFFTPLQDIHLYTKIGSGDIMYVKMFIIIAIFILLMACINFSNLSTARASKRACEIGIKKTLGSSRKAIMLQFFTEAIVTCFIAFTLALVLIETSLPYINNLIGVELQTLFYSDMSIMAIFIGIAVLTGIIAGSYSAFYLSSFNPIRILKGELTQGKKGAKFRGGLVVLQFSISIFLIISTLIINKQLNFITDKDLGYKKENFIKIEQANFVKDKDTFKQELMNIPGVKDASFASGFPGNGLDGKVMYKCNPDKEKQYSINIIASDYDFVKTMGCTLTKGRFLSKKFASDSSAVVLNETAVKEFGLTEPIGSVIRYWKYKLNIVGVIKDFHNLAVKTKVSPMLITLNKSWYHIPDKIAIRLTEKYNENTIEQIEKVWNRFTGNTPMQYSYFDNIVENLNREESNNFKTFTSFSLLAIFIACIGLLGLVSFTIEQRYKEIGIRKVYGAPTSSILLRLNLNIIKWLLISFIIASPIAYYFMNNWLDDFAYRISIGVYEFLITIFATVMICLATVSWQVYTAAMSNPIDSIKHE
jgi:putative ABC transport system permease protein